MSEQTQSSKAREAKLDAIHDQLTRSVEALVTGDDWRRALEFAARFRSRSAGRTGVFKLRECSGSSRTLGRLWHPKRCPWSS